MGGQSFECKFCNKWFLHKNSLVDHIRDKHHKTWVEYVDCLTIDQFNDIFTSGVTEQDRQRISRRCETAQWAARKRNHSNKQ